MSDAYIGEIRLFAGNFAPKNWAFCDGSILAIASNTALFSILGTTYGGNGQTTFALPDLRGRVAISPGNGPGLPNYVLGEMAGEPAHTLINTEMPAHTHVMSGVNGDANTGRVAGGAPANSETNIYAAGAAPNAPMAGVIGPSGGSQPHNNMQPYLAVNYIICLYGIYPPRN